MMMMMSYSITLRLTFARNATTVK